MTPAQELIEQEIRRFGPMSFDTFVDIALYHPTYGYYNRAAPQRGRGGDYFTSLQVGHIFPTVVADAVIAMKRALGTNHFSLVEWGSGGGELLERVLGILKEKKEIGGVHVWAVERSRAACDVLKRKFSRFPRCEVISSLDELEAVGGIEGCFLSNEFFDALPFQRFRYYSDGWRELKANLSDGRLFEDEIPVSREWQEKLDRHFPIPESETLAGIMEGHEVEYRPVVTKWMERWSEVLVRGYALTFDYGYPRWDLLSSHRKSGTWLCYSNHTSNADIFDRIGDQDITAHLDFTQLVETGQTRGLDANLFCSQGVFLSHVGQQSLEKYMNEVSDREKPKFIAALQQLVHPNAMGEKFWVLVQSKGLAVPTELSKIPNRINRLKTPPISVI